jgi:hypothetical protein
VTLRLSISILLAAVVLPLAAQPRTAGAQSGVRSELRLQGYHFGNFFQASEAALAEDVRAAGAEYRIAYRPGTSPTDFYAHANYLNYLGIDRDDSYGGRVGIAHFGQVHEFNVFADRAENRAAFDVGDITATANITTFSADYAFRMTPHWQLGAEAVNERQRFDAVTGRDNDYSAIGGSIRYRGFGRMFSPQIGYVKGERDVEDERESFDDSYWYARVIVNPNPRLYMSVRYRDRTREYLTTDLVAGNFGRQDDRNQWSATAVYQFTPALGGTLYYAREDVQSSRPGRNFDTDLLVLGLNIGF